MRNAPKAKSLSRPDIVCREYTKDNCQHFVIDERIWRGLCLVFQKCQMQANYISYQWGLMGSFIEILIDVIVLSLPLSTLF